MIVWEKKRLVLYLIFVLNILVFPTVSASPRILFKNAQYNTFDHLTSISGDSSSYYTIFNDNFSLGYWDLYDVSDRIIDTNAVPTDDADVSTVYRDENRGNEVDVCFYEGTGMGDWAGYIKYEYPYLDLNKTQNSIFTCTEYGTVYQPYIYVYSTSNFNENSILWDNAPPGIALLNAQTSSLTSLGLGSTLHYCYKFIQKPGNTVRTWSFYSSETYYKPRVHHYFSKNYQGNGMIYMQTDEPEVLNLRSNQYLEQTQILGGDKVNITFQTTSTNIMFLKFFNDNAEVKQITVSPNGNSNFIRQTVELELDRNFEFNRLMFSGTFESTQFFKCYNIDIVRPVLDDQPDDADDPKEQAENEKKDDISDETESPETFLTSSVIGSTFIGVGIVALLSVVVVRRVQVINAKKKEWKWISDPDLINELEK